MYELWLGLNIAWEIAVAAALPIALGLVALAGLWVAALLRIARAARAAGPARAPAWGCGWRAALAAWAVAAGLAFLVLPAATGSSLGQLGYWVDSAFLAALALGLGALVAAAVWPLAVLCSRRCAAGGA